MDFISIDHGQKNYKSVFLLSICVKGFSFHPLTITVTNRKNSPQQFMHFLIKVSMIRNFSHFCFHRAKLACLFGLDQESSQGNESFQYTAPKQPRKTTTQGKTRGTNTSDVCDVEAALMLSFSSLQQERARSSLQVLQS